MERAGLEPASSDHARRRSRRRGRVVRRVPGRRPAFSFLDVRRGRILTATGCSVLCQLNYLPSRRCGSRRKSPPDAPLRPAACAAAPLPARQQGVPVFITLGPGFHSQRRLPRTCPDGESNPGCWIESPVAWPLADRDLRRTIATQHRPAGQTVPLHPARGDLPSFGRQISVDAALAQSPEPGSNRRPFAYEANALPTELSGHRSRHGDSNPGPAAYRAAALPAEL